VICLAMFGSGLGTGMILVFIGNERPEQIPRMEKETRELFMEALGDQPMVRSMCTLGLQLFLG
jgi:hypothetical protein